MSLVVREVFSTMQGEGSRTGVPCVFIRFSGCNLWTGTPETRDTGTGVCARWCDTDFHGGTRFAPSELVDRVLGMMDGWPSPAVVISGGEPLLNLRRPGGEVLVSLLRESGVHVAVETNGTLTADILGDLDHITVSPKALKTPGEDPLGHIVLREGTDLKVVWPQWHLDLMERMNGWNFVHRYVQPLDDGRHPVNAAHESLAVASRLGWRVSVQVHKFTRME